MDLSRTLDIFEGNLNINAGGVLTYTENNAYIKDWIYRHEGLQKAIYNHQLLIEALGDNAARGRYIALKRNHLNGIALNLRDMFKMEFKRYLEAGMTQELAKAKAMKFTTEYKKKALEQHNKQYPEDFNYVHVMKLLEVKKEGVEHGDK